MPKNISPKRSSEIFPSRYDSRSDLGYGRTSNKFHKPRPHGGGSYPYSEKSEHDVEGTEVDEETHLVISKKNPKHRQSDPFIKKGTNPFYFAGGNTKLSDCFFRIDSVLREVFAMANSLVPIPGMTKNRKNFSGGSRASSSSISGQTLKRTGSEKGFSSAPPEIKYDKSVNDEDEVIFNLEDLVKKLEIETGNFRF